MFSCNVVSRWAQLVSFLNCLQDVKLSRIAIYRDEFRRMNCSLNWNFISCGELHCDSVKIKTMNSSLFFLRQCKSFNWSDCLVVLLLSATHFRKSGHARLIRGCFSFSQCVRAGLFSSLSLPPPPPPRSLWLDPSPPLFGKFQHGASKYCALKKTACTAGYENVTPSSGTSPLASYKEVPSSPGLFGLFSGVMTTGHTICCSIQSSFKIISIVRNNKTYWEHDL